MDAAIDVSVWILQTPRLILRPFEEKDLNDFFAYASVPGVGEMAGWPHHQSIEISKMVLDSFMAEKNVFALFLKEERKVVGSLGLHPSWLNDEAQYAALSSKEIGYALSKSCWGRGLMPEAVKEVVRFCFDDLKLDALSVGHFSHNAQSRRVIEKCGFEYVKSGVFQAKQLGKEFEDRRYMLLNPALKHS